jgi:NADP-dependent 3-hydroxy acid dehydrogenase YdfG
MSKRLEGKVALVTGAGSVGPGWGNGRAIAVRLAEEGARVFAVDLNADSMEETVKLARETGGEIETGICDVTSSDAIAATVAACVARFGGIDILVNNVGGSAAGGPVEMSEEVWATQIDRNLKSVFLTCKHVLPLMEKAGQGAIVNLASTSATRWTGAPQVAYSAAKAGVIQLCAWPNNAPAATCRRSSSSARRGFRCPSWATAATPPTRCCFWPRTRHASSPAPSWWWTAACPCAATDFYFKEFRHAYCSD